MKVNIFTLIAMLIILLLACFIPGCSSLCDSEDGGDNSLKSWKMSGMEGESITAILPHPDSANVIYVGSQSVYYDRKPGGVFRSEVDPIFRQ